MLFFWLSAISQAGGYYYSDAGIVATGRGGAFVAGADTQFAQYYNPAGLIRIEAPTINVGVSGVQQNVGFSRLRDPADPLSATQPFYDEVNNQAAPFVIPQFGFATPLGRRVGLAVGFYSPFAPSAQYDEEGPQRYSVKDSLIYQFSVGPSVAVAVHDRVTLGLGLQWQYLQVGQSLDIVAPGFAILDDDFDNPTGEDIAVNIQGFEDIFSPSFNLGLLVDPIDQVTIGLSFQAPTQFSANGGGSLDFTGSNMERLLQETEYTDDDVDLSIALPLVARAGVAVRPLPWLEIEAAAVYQRWSSLEDLVVENVDIEVNPRDFAQALLPPEDRAVDETLSLPASFRDTWSWRLGAEARLNEWLEVRAGGFYENGGVPTEQLSVSLVDPWKVQLGGGGSVHLLDEQLRLDVAAAGLIFPSLQIRDSMVSQVDSGVRSPTNEDAQPIVVGNGDLRASGWVLGLQASWVFQSAARKSDE